MVTEISEVQEMKAVSQTISCRLVPFLNFSTFFIEIPSRLPRFCSECTYRVTVHTRHL